MNGNARRQELLNLMKKNGSPLSGERLAKLLGVSRQIIVQDIALLRAANHDILSTNRGYLCVSPAQTSRVFHVNHGTDDIMDELNTVVDFGGTVADVFIKHGLYGELRARLDVRTRRDAREFMDSIRGGNQGPLMIITRGDHYHTVLAASEELLDEIEEELKRKGFLL